MNSGTCWDHRRIATKVAIGVVGTFVAMGVAACSGGSSNPSVAPTTTAPPSATAPAKAGHAHRLIGQIPPRTVQPGPSTPEMAPSTP